MKETFKKYMLNDFFISKVTDCRHATWLKINFFTVIYYGVTGVTGWPQLASLQFFDLQFLRIPYWQLQLFHRALSKIIKMHCGTMHCDPKRFYEDPNPKKYFCRVKNKIKCFTYKKKCFKVLDRGANKNLTCISF